MSNIREQITTLHILGKSQKEISNKLKISKQTVSYNIIKFKKTGSTKDRPRSGRKKTATTKKNINRVKRAIKRKPFQSARNLAKKLGIKRESTRKILKKHLNLKPYKRRKKQLISEKNIKKRLTRCKELKKRFGDVLNPKKILFTDEKIFSIQQTYNRQNNRTWAENSDLVRKNDVQTSQKPKGVMVWAGITRNGKTPLIFFKEGLKVNQHIYKKMLENKLLPWTKKHFKNQFWTFQQDSARPHTAKSVQNWIKNNFPDFINSQEWPPSSPDLNPMDYSIWGILESRVCTKNYSVSLLKEKIKTEWRKLKLETIQKCYDNWEKRIQKCIKAKGRHFE